MTEDMTDSDRLREFVRQSARAFVHKECDEWRCLEWDKAGTYPKEVFDQIADLGWYGIGIPEELGGSGGTASDLLVVAEELGRGSTDLVACFSLTASGLRTVVTDGSDAQKAELVPAIMSGGPVSPSPSPSRRPARTPRACSPWPGETATTTS